MTWWLCLERLIIVFCKTRLDWRISKCIYETISSKYKGILIGIKSPLPPTIFCKIKFIAWIASVNINILSKNLSIWIKHLAYVYHDMLLKSINSSCNLPMFLHAPSYACHLVTMGTHGSFMTVFISLSYILQKIYCQMLVMKKFPQS